MENLVDEPVDLVERVCAIDIGKTALVACVRVPHETLPGRRAQEVREQATTTGSLLGLPDWLRCQQVELVAMEATSDYWKPVYYLLEAQGLRCWLLNAKHVKNVPGRPKTDKLDAVWLAKVVERSMCRPSLVHPRPIRQVRDACPLTDRFSSQPRGVLLVLARFVNLCERPPQRGTRPTGMTRSHFDSDSGSIWPVELPRVRDQLACGVCGTGSRSW